LELIKIRARLATLTGEEAEKLRKRVEELEREIEKAKKRIANTKLIVNSATGKPRGVYPKLFRVFLNFEAGAKPEAIRNIVDTYIACESKDEIVVKVVELARKLRDGILVFVPIDKGIEFAEEIAEKLKSEGFRAEAFHAKKQVELIDRFARGEIDILVGVASYYGVLVRGIDLPERVKYVIFAGVPRHKFSTRMETISPTDIVRMLAVIREVLEGEEKEKIEIIIGRVSRRLRTMSQGALALLREKFMDYLQKPQSEREKMEEETPILRDLYMGFEILKHYLAQPDILVKLEKLGDIGLVKENGELYILIPDVATYIQASGRCSRLYPGGITKGLSVILVDDIRLLNGLVKRMRWLFEGFNLRNLYELDLDSLIKEIEAEREKVRKILSGEIQPEQQLELVKTVLLIVESPNKARTIANFFGKPSIRIVNDVLRVYEVTMGNYIIDIVASGGHIYELIVDESPPEKGSKEVLYGIIIDKSSRETKFIPIYTDIKKCPNGHQFTNEDKCPKCDADISTSDRKLYIVEALRKLASEVDIVLIGTDPDAEGEKIAWDLRVLLEPYAEKIQRIEFHEVTRRAIINAILNPRDFNERLVEAQIVRRVEDRWLGFSLSHIVQRYAWSTYCFRYLYQRNQDVTKDPLICCRPNRNLSAGRVQTPVLGFIIEEYNKTKDPAYSKYIVNIHVEGDVELSVELDHNEASSIFKTLDGRSKLKAYELPNVVLN